MKKKTLYIIGGVALALGIGLFVWNRSKKDGDISKKSGDFGFDDDFQTPISPKLRFIQNTGVASYLSSLLSDSEQTSLRGWVNLINQEKANDSSKFPDANGLTGEKSIIGHALYQMNKQGLCSNCWSQDVLFALQDA